jgi:hypothetical protein
MYLPIAGNGSNGAIIHLERDVETNNGVARLDVFKDISGDIGVL